MNRREFLTGAAAVAAATTLPAARPPYDPAAVFEELARRVCVGIDFGRGDSIVITHWMMDDGELRIVQISEANFINPNEDDLCPSITKL